VAAVPFRQQREARNVTTRRRPKTALASTRRAPTRRQRTRDEDDDLLADADASLLELVDNVLNRGVMITGDLVLGLAQVDLIYVRISALLCAADRVLGPKARR
jgi:hypothetical protein